MPHVVIDCETNGLMDYKRSADAEGQPRVAEFAAILVNDDLEVEAEFQRYIQPDGWSMTPEAAAKNGLTDEMLISSGVPIAAVLEVYRSYILDGRSVIAFGAQFDLKMMRSEFRRAGMPDLFEETRNVCTMRKANGIILKEGGKKGWPSLKRCREVLGLSSEGAHGAVKDAMDALAVYRHLIVQGVDMTPEVHHHANVEEIRANG